MSSPTPFKIAIPDAKLESIRQRVAAYPWYPAPEGEQGFEYGMDTSVLKDIQSYWLNQYDWRKAEADLNAHPQFIANIDGLDIHYVHIVGEAEGKRPLLLTHGWPGSIYEFWATIGPLAFPSLHGGKAEDAFDLIIPSLPGYAFSGRPAAPIGPRKVAALWNELMTETLGYDTYLAQGGDWGGIITSWIGFDHGVGDNGKGCKAIHLNMMGFRPTPATPQSDEELAWLQQTQASMQMEGAYLQQHMTKPQTIAMALMDSPMGTAAWILEKFHGWSDLPNGKLEDIYTRDQLLTNVMLYLTTDSIATSVWIYNGFAREGGNGLPDGVRCETPTGFANFPGETIYNPAPRSWCDRAYNITHWTDMAKGGHFGAMEQPSLFVEEIKHWARKQA